MNEIWDQYYQTTLNHTLDFSQPVLVNIIRQQQQNDKEQSSVSLLITNLFIYEESDGCYHIPSSTQKGRTGGIAYTCGYSSTLKVQAGRPR